MALVLIHVEEGAGMTMAIDDSPATLNKSGKFDPPSHDSGIITDLLFSRTVPERYIFGCQCIPQAARDGLHRPSPDPPLRP